MGLHRFLVVVIVCGLTVPTVRAQETPVIDVVLDKLENYAAQYPQEKVYVHLDKPYYTVGDDVWFKGYVTIGAYNQLSGLSKILYVDLVGPENNMVQSIRLPLIAGVTMGDFQLADSLDEGNYRIRAYTNWMRNFESDIFYDRLLPVGNARTDNIVAHSTFSYENSPVHRVHTEIAFTDLDGGPFADMDASYQVVMEGRNIARGRETTDEEGRIAFDFVNKQPFNLQSGDVLLTLATPDKRTVNKRIPLKTTSNTNSIQFFPESGHLIAGHLTKVAFKALAPEGTGIAVKGYLQDETGAPTTAFASTYAGMGSFSFIPAPGIRYTASVVYADGSEAEVDLPEVKTSGYALAVNSELDRQLFVQSYASDDLVAGQEMALVLQRNGTVFYASKSRQTKNDLVFSIPRENLPIGVIQVTLFAADDMPVAQRTVFNYNDTLLLPLAVETDRKVYGQKEKVIVQLNVGQPSDTSRIATLSAAVVDMAKVPIDSGIHEGNIYASLLLSSDIRGYIETPAYYFETADLASRRQLDNLMLSQGWSRINWQELMAGKNPAMTYAPEQDLRVSGTVTSRNGKTPVPNAVVTLMSTGDITAVVDTISDADGRFNFDRLLFYDDTRFVVQARDERGRKNVDIVLDEVPRQQVTRNRNAPDATVDVNQSIQTYLKNTQAQFEEMEKYGLREKTILLEEVKVTEQAENEKVRHSSNLNGPGNADQIINVAELSMGCATLDMCLQGRLLGVVFRNGIPYSTRSINQQMQIVLDGMYMEAEALSMINPFDVETVEVLRGVGTTAIYGSRGSGGVLVITTKRGDSAGYNRELYTPGIVTHSPQGYYEVREFYAPDYHAPLDSLADMKDLRTTIHWAPNIITNEEGVAAFEFYTAETPGTYRIVVEGLDVDGRLGRAVHYITVE